MVIGSICVHCPKVSSAAWFLMAESACLPMTVLDADVASHQDPSVLRLQSHLMLLHHQQVILGWTLAHA